jgi:type VI secretion system protein ImpH
MAKETRAATPGQLGFIFKRPTQVSFYQALLALERNWRTAVGEQGPAADERVRLRPSIQLSFPVADIESIEVLPATETVQLTTTFLGLYGVDSPLPSSYPERLAQISQEDRGVRVRAFLDIFHHRLLSLLFRTWKKYRPVSGPDTGADEPLYRRLMALAGFEDALGLGGDSAPHLWETRLLVQRPPNAYGLESALRRRLGYPIQVEQLVRRWVAIPPDQRSRLGAANCGLGSTLVAGSRVEDCNKIRIQVDADDYKMFLRLLPGEEDWNRIETTVRRYLRDPIDYDVEVKLPRECIVPCSLGNRESRLGLSMWHGRPRGQGKYSWYSKTVSSW